MGARTGPKQSHPTTTKQTIASDSETVEEGPEFKIVLAIWETKYYFQSKKEATNICVGHVAPQKKDGFVPRVLNNENPMSGCAGAYPSPEHFCLL